MESLVVNFLKPCLWFLKITGGQHVTYFGNGTGDIQIKYGKLRQFYTILVHCSGVLAYLNHLTAIYHIFLSETFHVENLILVISKTAFSLQAIAIIFISYSSVPIFVTLINCLLEIEKISVAEIDFPGLFKLKYIACTFCPITICSFIYFCGVLKILFGGIYHFFILKWPSIVFAINYLLIKEIYLIMWWSIACLIYIFFKRANKLLEKLEPWNCSISLVENLRVLYQLLGEAAESLGSLFGFMILGFLVNSNLIIQFDMHSIQIIIYQFLSRDCDDCSAFKLLDSVRWLVVRILQILMVFYIICNKIEYEVSKI